MATQTPPPSLLREFCPLYYLLNAIPAKVQKGFRSVVVYLTALDVTPDYIAVGSSIGMLYLYCRRLSTMNKYNLEGKCEAITAVKLLSCFDDLVAVGTASGRVALFQLVSQLPGRNKQLRRFDVVGIHKSTVTSLAWSTNGMKLFSGDDKGKVVFSSLDLDQGVCNPVLLLEEPSGVVQLEYSQKVLLVSTHQRSLLFFTQEQTQQQIGTKPRKSSGRFGVCFLPGLCKQSDLQIFAARPGLRLWRTDIRGLVEDTRLLKPLFNMEVPQVELFPRAGPVGGYRPRERQLGLLSCFLRDGWILSWNEYSVYVLDCVNQVIIGALESCGDIVSVSCCENEIFILKGDRDIVRISNSPEGLASNLSDLSLRLSSPLATPTLLPPMGSVETAQPIRTMAIIVEQGAGGRPVVEGEEEEEDDEEDVEGPVEEVEEAEEEDEQVEASERLYHRPSLATTDSRSRSSSVTSWDSVHGNALMTTSSTTEQSEMTASRYSAPLGHEDLQQELVVKAIKVRKKAKRRRQDSSSGNRLSESSWSESNFGLQDGGCYSDGGCSGETPLSDQTLPDLHGQDSPDLDQNRNQDRSDQPILDHPAESTDLDIQSSETPPASLPLSLLSEPLADSKAEPPTPDVDLLLECTFSYMHNSEETQDGQDLQPMEEQEDEFLSPLIGPEEEDEDEDMVPPSGVADQMFYSTVSCLDRQPNSVSSDEEDIYGHTAAPTSVSVGDGLSSLSLQTDRQTEEDKTRHKADQLAESWMGYSGPGCGILSLQVTDRYVWCLDFKGGLFCSSLSDGGLNWQKFEDNVHQMALSPSGLLLWKVEQRSMTAYACGKVTIKGKRHWYKAMEHTAFVALSDDTAWIVRTNGDLYLQTGLSVDRPCARSVKVECPCAFSQVCAVGGVVWALSEQRAVFYREGLTSYCSEGEMWKYDKISEAQGLEPICISLGENGTAWALDTSGSLWFRTGITPIKPQGEDDHWWQVSITDYVVFDQGSLFQTLLAATQSVATVTRAPVERVAECLRVAFLSQQAQCQPSLLAANSTGVWIASGRNHLHVAKGNLIGTFWQNVVPRGTVSATRWVFITSSSVPHKEGTFLWLAQSRKDLFCVWDQDGQLRPTTVQLPPEVELVQLSSCADALWGLDTHGRVHIRTLSPTCPTGLQWTLLDLNQLGPVRLVSLSCGSQNVWAVDAHGMVYFRVGTQPFNPSMMLPAWICIEPPEQPVGIHFVSVHTSPNDRLLWGVDNRGSVHVRTAISDEMPVGTDWEHVPGLSASQLVVSCRTVWVRCPSGEIARRYGITDKNPAGDYWKKIPGMAHWLTVTPDDELWAVTVSGGLSHRLTKSLPHTAKPLPSTSALSADDFDDEWEVI